MKIIKPNPKNWKLLYDSKAKQYADYDGYNGGKYEQVDNFVFESTLMPNKFYRGRSAAGFYFLTKDGAELTMRIAKVEELLNAILEGQVKLTKDGFKGMYTFFKQGANYSIGVYTE